MARFRIDEIVDFGLGTWTQRTNDVPILLINFTKFTNDGFPMWHTCCGFLVACSKGRRMKTMFSQILGFGLAFKTQKLKKSLAPPMAAHHK